MGLKDTASDLRRQRGERSCVVRTTRARLQGEDLDDFNAMLDDATNWSAEVLSAALTEQGHPVSGQGIRRHRNRGCSCGAAS